MDREQVRTRVGAPMRQAASSIPSRSQGRVTGARLPSSGERIAASCASNGVRTGRTRGRWVTTTETTTGAATEAAMTTETTMVATTTETMTTE